MTLTRYKQKRNFRKTPEPKGGIQAAKGSLRFVVQKHAASHLHYDFRLELDGVLKSWALPKGPSLNPMVKRLAVMVEDHPLEYRTFEGAIPEGNYGAGDVIVWDEGTYHAHESTNPRESERLLKRGLEEGNMRIVLEGKKLKGAFALIRTGPPEKKSWLLFKRRDQFATDEEDVLEDARSVRSGKLLKGDSETTPKRRARPQPAPERATTPPEREPNVQGIVRPMLAYLTKTAFDDPGWLYEVKYDGYRAVAEVRREGVRFYSRSGNSFTQRYAPIVESLQKLRDDVVLDGEVVVTDETGRSQFQLLQNYQRTGKGNLQYYVFDILSLNGRDLTSLPLVERKKLLRSALPALPHVHFSDHVVGDGIAFLETARKQHLEGIMAKDMKSPYRQGERSHEWMKIKTGMRQEAVIAGFTAPRGARKHLGALVLGVYDGDDFVYVGHAGGGFNQISLREVKYRLDPLVQRHSPFTRQPKALSHVTWVKPELVCEVAFAEWTDEGILRQPIFLGLREDKNPREVVREIPGEREETVQEKHNGRGESTDLTIGRRTLKVTHLDKLYWPEDRITKGDLLEYYRKIARYMLPYLKDRPQSLHRHPNGIEEEGFYQKDLRGDLPGWMKTAELSTETNEKMVRYLVCTDESSLLYMANLGCIEINPWSSRVQSIDNPDYLVIDLDPEGVAFDAVVETALLVKKVLDRVGAASFCKTSGATGLHIYVPLKAKYDYDVASDFAHLVGQVVNVERPDLTSLERSPAKRRKKVYLDFLQNRKGQTLAAPYSVRARPGATVSTPLEWDEVKPGLDPSAFTIKTIFQRLETKGDLFRKVLGKGINVERCLEKLGDG